MLEVEVDQRGPASGRGREQVRQVRREEGRATAALAGYEGDDRAARGALEAASGDAVERLREFGGLDRGIQHLADAGPHRGDHVLGAAHLREHQHGEPAMLGRERLDRGEVGRVGAGCLDDQHLGERLAQERGERLAAFAQHDLADVESLDSREALHGFERADVWGDDVEFHGASRIQVVPRASTMLVAEKRGITTSAGRKKASEWNV